MYWYHYLFLSLYSKCRHLNVVNKIVSTLREHLLTLVYFSVTNGFVPKEGYQWPHKRLISSKLFFFTARVRSTREGNVLTPVCVSVHTCGGGYPISGLGRGGTPFQVWVGGTPSQVWGVPHLGSGGVPHLRSGGTPSQVRGYPISGWGVPQLRSGGVPHPRSGGIPSQVRKGWVPHLRSGGYPIPGLDKEGTQGTPLP